MQNQESQFHHYIPRFILRNFAIDNYERIFESDTKRQKKKGAKQQKKNKGTKQQKKNKRAKQQKKKKEVEQRELLQTYNKASNDLGVSLIRKTYGYQDMYIDLNHEDVMNVEEKLSRLEGQASEVIRNIINTPQVENVESEVVLLRKDLVSLRKFFFIMNYRNDSRWSQFTNEVFDNETWSMVKDFMQRYELKSAREVWLQNIREILETPHEDIKDNERIFSVDRDDYINRTCNYFLMIWQAGKNDEFVVTSNGFGIFEGVTGLITDGKFQFPYHSFYVISPKLVLVLCHISFRKEVGTERTYELFENKRSIFENVTHSTAIKTYVGRVDTNPLDWNDTFTFSFSKITSETVFLVNSILLNEIRPDLVLTFLSRPYLYKTIVKYHKCNKIGVQRDFSDLKRKLFIALNKTHDENLDLRRNISASYNWNVREL